jgi:hypothetical protein
MLESYQDSIVAGLINKGYSVGLASNGKIPVNHEHQVSAVLTFTLFKTDDPEIVAKQVYEELSMVLTDMKGYFYSVVVAETTNATWAGSNIFLQPQKQIPQLPPITDKNKKSKLN